MIGGTAKGRRLKAARGRAIRPTADRVREAIFDLLGPQGPGPVALDLFAGSGALGIEALSRGAVSAVFVDSDRVSVASIRKNLEACGLADRARVERCSVKRFLARLDLDAPFDLVLVDPPYGHGLIAPCLEALAAPGWLQSTGRIVVESEIDLELPTELGRLRLERHKRYGDTAIREYLNR